MEGKTKTVGDDTKKQSEKIIDNLDQTMVNATDKVAPVVVKAVDAIKRIPDKLGQTMVDAQEKVAPTVNEAADETEEIPTAVNDSLNKAKGAQK